MFGMFTEAGNNKVANIVANAKGLVNDYGLELAWDYAVTALEALADDADFEEACDTAVRGAVYDAVVCG